MDWVTRLQILRIEFPGWTIASEGRVFTATRRPTPSSLHMIYAPSLGELRRELQAVQG